MDYNHVKLEGAAVRKCYNIALSLLHTGFKDRDCENVIEWAPEHSVLKSNVIVLPLINTY